MTRLILLSVLIASVADGRPYCTYMQIHPEQESCNDCDVNVMPYHDVFKYSVVKCGGLALVEECATYESCKDKTFALNEAHDNRAKYDRAEKKRIKQAISANKLNKFGRVWIDGNQVSEDKRK